MPEGPKRFSHELLKDYPYDVYLHSEEGKMLHVSTRVDLNPGELHVALLRELSFRRRFQIGAFRYVGTDSEHAYWVLFRDPVPHDPHEPYPLSRIVIRPVESGSEVHVYGPRDVSRHVAYLLRTLARAVQRYRTGTSA